MVNEVIVISTSKKKLIGYLKMMLIKNLILKNNNNNKIISQKLVLTIWPFFCLKLILHKYIKQMISKYNDMVWLKPHFVKNALYNVLIKFLSPYYYKKMEIE